METGWKVILIENIFTFLAQILIIYSDLHTDTNRGSEDGSS